MLLKVYVTGEGGPSAAEHLALVPESAPITEPPAMEGKAWHYFATLPASDRLFEPYRDRIDREIGAQGYALFRRPVI